MKLSFSDTSGGVDGVEADVDDPGPYEGPPTNPQQIVADNCCQDTSVAARVHQAEPLGVVQGVESVQGQTQQEEEEQKKVKTLSHQGGLVQDFLLSILQNGLVVVVVVGEDTRKRVQDQP